MNDKIKAKKYQCVYLDPAFKRYHAEDAAVLFETDSLGEACIFIYDLWKKESKDIAVYQPRIESYRDYYQNEKRNVKGQFV